MEIIWKIIAFVLSRKAVARWLIARSQRTPYTHLDGYMNRWWLFNAYQGADGAYLDSIKWLPSIRVHQILRKDNAKHLHDHPWEARTIILQGGYTEETEDGTYLRKRGDTRAIRFAEYHHIQAVHGPTFTLFITWAYKGTWGFKVAGHKVPWRDYFAMYPERAN